MGKRIVMILAPGFEETEAIAVADVLLRVGLEVVLAGLESIEVVGAHNIKIIADALLDDLNASDFDCVVLPGGMPGSSNLRESDKVMAFTQAVYAGGGIAAAICAAPIALARFGLIEGKTITAYPGFESYFGGNVPTGCLTEVDGRIITGKGPGAVFEFGARIAAAFGLDTAVEQVLTGMFAKAGE